MKLYQIALGWWFLLKSKFTYTSVERAELAFSRLTICEQCEHKNTTFNSCKICGCYLPAKARVYTENCPDNRWMPVHYIEGTTDDYNTIIICEEVTPFLREKLYKYLGHKPETILLEKWEEFLDVI